jgi:hypothetical protein
LEKTAVCPTNLPSSTQQSAAIHFQNSPQWLEQRFAQHPFRRYLLAAGDRNLVVYRPFQWQRLRGVSLLAVWGDDIEVAVARWLATIWLEGVRWIHLLASPGALVRQVLSKTAVSLPLPINRNPYYLTAKPLGANTPASLFDFAQWHTIGGDIL